MSEQKQSWWKRLHIFWKTFLIMLVFGFVGSWLVYGRPLLYIGTSLFYAVLFSVLVTIINAMIKKFKKPKDNIDPADKSLTDKL